MTKKAGVVVSGKTGCRVKNGTDELCEASVLHLGKAEFYCTREQGHKGRHHAHGVRGECCATWFRSEPRRTKRAEGKK